MDIEDFKKLYILKELQIEPEKYGKIFTLLDYGNISHWFDEDRRDVSGKALAVDEYLSVDILNLVNFADVFSSKIVFYYGLDCRNKSSIHILRLARDAYAKVCSKNIQWIKHYLKLEDREKPSRAIRNDAKGSFVLIPKCNFDVEITMDALEHVKDYDTLCLFSSDNDFSALLKLLKGKGKKAILFHDNRTRKELKDVADLEINSQLIKKHIFLLKKTQRAISGEGLDIGPESTGRATP